MAAQTLVDVTKSHLWLKCPYESRAWAEALGGRWVADAKAWRYPRELQKLTEILHAFPAAKLSPTVQDWAGKRQEEATKLLALQEQEDAVLHHPNADKLRPYQRVGVEFLRQRKSGILADEMGLGKTFQTIATADLLPGDLNMIVCPNSLKETWRDELEKWSMFHGNQQVHIVPAGKAKREKVFYDWWEGEGRRWLIINYESLRLLPAKKPVINVFIADEAHRLKNRGSQQSKAVASLKRKHTLLLTGTPIMNRPDDLWHLLHLIDPKEFSSYWRFVNRYCTTIERYVGTARPVKEVVGAEDPYELGKLLKPYMIRRLKSDVLKDLPDKQHVIVPVTLEGKHKKAYDQMEQDAIAVLSNGEVIAAPIVIAQVTRLRQIAASPRSLGDEIDGPKIDWIVEHLHDSGKKLVVFSQFRTVIDALEQRLQKEKIETVRITGSEKTEQRQANVRRFQESDEQIACLCTTQAGGTGLTLTAADEVVFIDRAWTPAENAQAEDRLHRIGQKNNVTVYILIAKDTIEEDIDTKLETKDKTAKGILGDIQKRLLQSK